MSSARSAAASQLSVVADAGEPLVSGRRSLLCSRCGRRWNYTRSACPACGESDEARLLVYAEQWGGPVSRNGNGDGAGEAVFPHLRIAGCESCQRYLIEVDLGRDARAVPEVDELAAMPLDLYAADQGLTKVTPNLMGFYDGHDRDRSRQGLRLLHRHERLHRLQGLRGGVQGVEPAAERGQAGSWATGYDNTGSLDAQNWRHVKFIDNVPDEAVGTGNGKACLMMSDVCKHCQHASCMDVCPTGAIIRTEFDTVFIQPDVCNGCRNCIAACPYGVIDIDAEQDVAQKCTLCYDRLQGGMEPACAKACPTESIQFGPLDELQRKADERLATLHEQGVDKAHLYGRDEEVYGGLNAFFLLMDKPEVYELPERGERGPAEPQQPSAATSGCSPPRCWRVLGGVIALREGRLGDGKPAAQPEGERE